MSVLCDRFYAFLLNTIRVLAPTISILPVDRCYVADVAINPSLPTATLPDESHHVTGYPLLPDAATFAPEGAPRYRLPLRAKGLLGAGAAVGRLLADQLRLEPRSGRPGLPFGWRCWRWRCLGGGNRPHNPVSVPRVHLGAPAGVLCDGCCASW